MKKQRGSFSKVHLPHDIMVEVLARCPAKSLMRFKCVCKLWQSIIYDSQFARLHQSYSQTRWNGNYLVRFMLYPGKILISFKNHRGKSRSTVPGNIELDVIKYIRTFQFWISEPLDGLICIYSQLNRDAGALVLNISTRQIIQLPKSCLDKEESSLRSARYSLGFDPLTKEYKVLIVYACNTNYVFGTSCEIYTLGTNARRKIHMPALPNSYYGMESPCINGTIYFLTGHSSSSSSNLENFIIMAFEVGREIFRPVKLTAPAPAPANLRNLFAIGSDLVLAQFGDFKFEKPIELGFLEECDHKDQILLRETITFLPSVMMRNNSEGLGNRSVPMHEGLHISGISPTGEIILVDDERSIIVYLDLERKTWRKKQFRWPHDPMENRPPLFRKVGYNHVENIIRLKENS